MTRMACRVGPNVMPGPIPISLVSVFLVLAAMDRTVNIISLAGLSFAVGLVVDDAIVALENIDRHMKEFGKGPRQAAYDGVQEVWGAILSSTLVREPWPRCARWIAT